MFATITEILTPNCCTLVPILAVVLLLSRNRLKTRVGGSRAYSAATRVAKKAATNVLLDVVFKRKR